MNLQPCEENRICLALFRGTGKNVQLGPSEHWARHCPRNGLYRCYWFIYSCKNQEKTVLSVSVLRTCNFGFRSHLFRYQIFFCCQFNMKNTPFPIFATFAFFRSHIKLRFHVRPGPLISQVRQDPCGPNSALLGGFPQVSNSPYRLLLFSAVKTTICHVLTVNLISYT